MGLYCSDVAAAFDRVSKVRLLSKLRRSGVSDQLMKLLSSWLDERTAVICVEGCRSKPFVLKDMVFQCTVLGPPLWNVYYADANVPVAKISFTETVFADDLNCVRIFDACRSDSLIFRCLAECQSNVHFWGDANQVVFEASKEFKNYQCCL